MADEEKVEAKRDHEPPAAAETSARWTGGAKRTGYSPTSSVRSQIAQRFASIVRMVLTACQL